MAAPSLPEGWQWDFDEATKRWGFVYLASNHRQAIFPNAGDEIMFSEAVLNQITAESKQGQHDTSTSIAIRQSDLVVDDSGSARLTTSMASVTLDAQNSSNHNSLGSLKRKPVTSRTTAAPKNDKVPPEEPQQEERPPPLPARPRPVDQGSLQTTPVDPQGSPTEDRAVLPALHLVQTAPGSFPPPPPPRPVPYTTSSTPQVPQMSPTYSMPPGTQAVASGKAGSRLSKMSKGVSGWVAKNPKLSMGGAMVVGVAGAAMGVDVIKDAAFIQHNVNREKAKRQTLQSAVAQQAIPTTHPSAQQQQHHSQQGQQYQFPISQGLGATPTFQTMPMLPQTTMQQAGASSQIPSAQQQIAIAQQIAAQQQQALYQQIAASQQRIVTLQQQAANDQLAAYGQNAAAQQAVYQQQQMYAQQAASNQLVAQDQNAAAQQAVDQQQQIYAQQAVNDRLAAQEQSAAAQQAVNQQQQIYAQQDAYSQQLAQQQLANAIAQSQAASQDNNNPFPYASQQTYSLGDSGNGYGQQPVYIDNSTSSSGGGIMDALTLASVMSSTATPTTDPTASIAGYDPTAPSTDTAVPGITDASLDANAAYNAQAQIGQENAISLIDGTEWTTLEDDSCMSPI